MTFFFMYIFEYSHMYWPCLGELINPITKGFSLWVFIHCSASTQMSFSIIFLSYFHIKIVPPYNPLLHETTSRYNEKPPAKSVNPTKEEVHLLLVITAR